MWAAKWHSAATRHTLVRRYDCRAVMHPWVAEPLRDVRGGNMPWLPRAPIVPEELWPVHGEWEWGGNRFNVAPWTGR
jgi:hypothetical protein